MPDNRDAPAPAGAAVLFWGQPLSIPSDRPGHAELSAALARSPVCEDAGQGLNWDAFTDLAELRICAARAAQRAADTGGAAAVQGWLEGLGFDPVARQERPAGTLMLFNTDGPGVSLTGTWAAQRRPLPLAPAVTQGAYALSLGLTLSAGGRVLHTDAALLRQ
ncbi:hypothetical protein [Aestuariicoccus sp. MJ-SS9]|uniref:hypothetical protein n=1 Tax=Aestuariicoccus sp. MJ-SS9 TaxID=3079855 RepID=UPI002907AE65|nr:hypothetical protein [Aestuariicoccus sp. MJ-SS9]MDU8912151.1 hypothetical protein [Aestuariicoccus sp. MJ-SS9]